MIEPHSPLVNLTAEEQRDALIMVRYAVEAQWHKLRWSLPNDASWSGSYLAGVPVRHDSIEPGRYDLTGTKRFGQRCEICGIVRRENGFEIWGVPGDEWLRPPVLPGEALVSTRSYRSRTVAVAAALLVPVATFGGVALTGADSGGGDSRVVPAQATPAYPFQYDVTSNDDAWAEDLKVRLTAVTRELDEVDQAERSWSSLPAAYRSGEPPVAVRELQRHRVELQQLKAALESDLATWEAARDERLELVDAERRLAEVKRAAALDGTTQVGERLSIDERRLADEVAERRARVADLSEVVATATKTPPPEPVDATPAALKVRDLAENPPHPPSPPRSEGPDVLANGREFDTPRAEVPVDHDPEPPEPDPEPERHDDPGPPVHAAVDADEGVKVGAGPVDVSVGGDDGGSPDIDERPAPQPRPAPDLVPEVEPEPEPEPLPVQIEEVDTEPEPAPAPTPDEREDDRPAPDPEPGVEAPSPAPGDVDYGAEFEKAYAEVSPEDRAQFERDLAAFNAQLEGDVQDALTDLEDGDIDDPSPPGNGWPTP